MRLLCSAALSLGLLAGCTSAPLVPVAPPTPKVEQSPPKPGVGVFWRSARWAWQEDLGYYWVVGRWERERPGFFWLPGYWEAVQGGDQRKGWVWVEARWERS